MNFQAYSLTAHPEWACITVKADESEARTPVHLCCVIDTSGSMGTSNKLLNVKKSLMYLLDFLGPQDFVSIITFSDVARTVVKKVAVTAEEKENIRARISLIRADSNTNLSAGIVESRESLTVDNEDLKQGILLLTDGIANMGLTRPEDILEIVRSTVDKFTGTSISCVGYGIDHNVELLQQISGAGGGSYYVVNNLEDVAVVFGDVLGGLVSCVAQQVRIELPLGTEVKTRYSVNNTAEHMEIMIGDLPAGSEAVVLAKTGNGVSNAVAASVVLKAYDLIAHANIVYATAISTTADETLQTSGEAHYLRFEVLDILEQSRRLIENRSSDPVVNAHLRTIAECIERITTYRTTHEHSLWDMLIAELNECKHNLENRHRATHETSHVMSQHSTVLGRMRGIAAQSPMAISTEVPLQRAFSNTTQRNISSQLHTTLIPSSMTIGVADDPMDVLSQMNDDFEAISVLTNSPLTPPPFPVTRQNGLARAFTNL